MTTREARFWAMVDVLGGPDACWPWTGARSSGGYGSFDHDGAHRVSLAIDLGRPIAPGMQACHTCDNPPCVNPRHLFEGSNRVNAGDRQAKGRSSLPTNRARGDDHPSRSTPGWAQGATNGRARLTETDVREIRQRFATGLWTHARLAETFGISVGAVKHITARRTWKHVV